jgi:hypothetical protein
MPNGLRLKNQGYKLSVIIALWRNPCKLTGCFTCRFAPFNFFCGHFADSSPFY